MILFDSASYFDPTSNQEGQHVMTLRKEAFHFDIFLSNPQCFMDFLNSIFVGPMLEQRGKVLRILQKLWEKMDGARKEYLWTVDVE